MKQNWGERTALAAWLPLICHVTSPAMAGTLTEQVIYETARPDSGSSTIYQDTAESSAAEKSDLAAPSVIITPASASPETANPAPHSDANQLGHARYAAVCGDGSHLDVAAARAMVKRIATARGDDVRLSEGLIQAESGFIQDQVSEKGAIGLSQLTPATAQELGVNPCNPEENVKGGLAYLAQLRAQFGNPVFALAAYNAGPDRIEQFHGVPPFKETLNYVAGILTDYYRDGNAPALTAPINGQRAKARATEYPSKTKPQASEASLADWKSGFVMNLD